jgi:hypothetical protein
MRNRLDKGSNNFAFWLAAGVGLIFIAFAAFSGVIQRFFNGEEFFVYQYAFNYSHLHAWQTFFLQKGRLIEALYWTYQFEILGHHPLFAHSLSFVLQLITALAAAACFVNVWPKSFKTNRLIFVFVFLFFLNWVSMSSVLRLSYDNTRISVFFFFLAGLALQRWAVGQRARWLVLSFALFLTSLLTYENAAFLFPALLLLALPLLPDSYRTSKQKQLFYFGGLTAVSWLVLLVPVGLYRLASLVFGRTISTPVLEFELTSFLANMFASGVNVYSQFGLFGISGSGFLKALVAVGLIISLLLSTLAISRINGKKNQKDSNSSRLRWTSIYLASAWLLIFGPLPYVLVGYGADIGGRLYSSAVFGLFPLLLINFHLANRILPRVIAAVSITIFAVVGLLELSKESAYFNRLERPLNHFFLQLKVAVPHVRPHTMFILINGPISYVGCGPSLEMLYNQRDLECMLLTSFDPEFHAVRKAMHVETAGLDWHGPDWILIDVSDGTPSVIAQLDPGDLELLIAWESTEPIRTNFRRIQRDQGVSPSEFYLDLLYRARVLGEQ